MNQGFFSLQTLIRVFLRLVASFGFATLDLLHPEIPISKSAG